MGELWKTEQVGGRMIGYTIDENYEAARKEHPGYAKMLERAPDVVAAVEKINESHLQKSTAFRYALDEIIEVAVGAGLELSDVLWLLKGSALSFEIGLETMGQIDWKAWAEEHNLD
jgi:hypothetical protein